MAAPDPEAPAVLVIHGNGTVVLQIADHTGEVLDYAVEADPEGPGYGVVLRRLDGAAGPYRVWKERGRTWRCACPAFHFKKGPHGPYGCKHVAAVRPLSSFCRRLRGQPEAASLGGDFGSGSKQPEGSH